MYAIKGMKQCSCYELDNKEKTLLIEVEHPGGKREEIIFQPERVAFFIHPRALSG